jgi:lipopolysaccharide transport system ATP-binding protein
MHNAIRVEGLSKLYHLGGRGAGYRTFRETVSDGAAAVWQRLRRAASGGGAEPAGHELWALKDVSFDVAEGAVVGVIGRNGAGKSTLLKVVSRITEPTSGQVRFRGRVGSLLEVGTGFHHELTGRENIYLNGAICGMKRCEIDRKFDEIVEFAEVGQFLDTPVKRYSSGMFVRLAFAVAAHMEPEILLVDEVLAVGDATFQKKCLGKMNDVSRSGRTILFVSHNMATILNLCDQVVVLERGKLLHYGSREEGIRLYMRDANQGTGGDVELTDHPNRRNGCRPVLAGVRLLNRDGCISDQVLCGEPISLEVRVNPACGVSDPHVAIGFEDSFGCRVFTAATYLTGTVPDSARRSGRFVCALDQLPLAPGRYCLTLNAGPLHAAWTDVVDQALWFDVVASDFYGNGKLPNADWGRVLVRSRWSAGSRCPSA